VQAARNFLARNVRARPLVANGAQSRKGLPRGLFVPSQQENRFASVSKARARQRAIGIILRTTYRGITQEPVPREFLDLLRKIDEAERQRRQHQRKTT
jgi:anti-sigma factor NepR-like protein